jgi:hypothetical protein
VVEGLEEADLVFELGGDVDVVLARCGIGKVNAARCAQILIDRSNPDYLINTGVAGPTPIDVTYNVRFKNRVTLQDGALERTTPGMPEPTYRTLISA